MEIPRRAGGLQVHLDHIARAGACHDARHAEVLQRRQKLLKPLFAGYALGKAGVGQLPDLGQQLLRVAGYVGRHMAAEVFPRQPAPAGRKFFHIRRQGQPQLPAGRLPQGIPQPLGVKHQPVHIKNNAFNHRGVILSRFCFVCSRLLYRSFGVHATPRPTAFQLSFPGYSGRRRPVGHPCRAGPARYACRPASACRPSRWPRAYNSVNVSTLPSNRLIVIGSCGRRQ